MKVSPMAGAAALDSGVNHQYQADAKARAISKLTGKTAPQQQSGAHPQGFNQTNISPEMVSAVIPPTPTVNPELVDESNPYETRSTETPVVPAPDESQEAKPSPSSSAQLQALVRREKALRLKAQQQEQQLKAREEALKAKEAEIEAKNKDYTGYFSKDQVKQNALRVLADAGVSYDDLTQQILNQGQSNPYMESQIARLEAEIQRLSAKTEESQKTLSSQQEQSKQAALNQISRDVRNLVTKDPAFETIKATGSTKDVVELIEKTFNEEGYVMSVEEACEEVENYLVEEATKLAKLQKIQKRLQPTPATSVTQTQSQSKQPQPMKTLTNAVGATRKLSARERAIAAMEGRLK